MDFAVFKSQVEKLSGLISADSFSPDLIIGIARGGWCPAMLLSRFLNVNIEPNIRKILVVEDFLESGKCIKYVVDELSANGRDIRTAALGYLPKKILIPTYSLGQIEKIPNMPWDT